MPIVITTISIFAFAGLVWLFNQILSFRICAICAGVSGTWLWMLAAKFLNYEIDILIPAMLMGGSVVGIAYQIEKRLSNSQSPLLLKTLFIPPGFVAVYSVISLTANPFSLFWWAVLIAIIIFLVAVALKFTEKPHPDAVKNHEMIKKLEEKLKNCC